jgi:hypothetical protein
MRKKVRMVEEIEHISDKYPVVSVVAQIEKLNIIPC